MSELIRDSSLCQAFACYRMDTPANSSFFPVEPHSHYFSEVMLIINNLQNNIFLLLDVINTNYRIFSAVISSGAEKSFLSVFK